MNDLALNEIPADDWNMIEQIGRLRVRSWATEVPQAAAMTTWLDEFDRVGRHWAFLWNGEPVAAARLTVHKSIDEIADAENYTGMFPSSPRLPIASFNRLVVEPTVRGRGLCEKLDRIRLEAAESMGCRCAIGATPSGERRVRHMQKLGFRIVGIGCPDSSPPLCYLPPPVVLICDLPRRRNPARGPSPSEIFQQ